MLALGFVGLVVDVVVHSNHPTSSGESLRSQDALASPTLGTMNAPEYVPDDEPQCFRSITFSGPGNQWSEIEVAASGGPSFCTYLDRFNGYNNGTAWDVETIPKIDDTVFVGKFNQPSQQGWFWVYQGGDAPSEAVANIFPSWVRGVPHIDTRPIIP